MEKKLTEKQFIGQIKGVLGDSVDYSKVKYEGTRVKILLHCKKHDKDFTKYPFQIIRLKQGCPLCGYEKSRIKQSQGKETFIQKSKALYGEWYDFSKTNYINNKTDAVITCPKHGDFKRRPDLFLMGYGCPKCKNKHIINRKPFEKYTNKLSNDEFIQKAKRIFGDKYDYSGTAYMDSNHPISVICPIHGVFSIMPYAHINLREGCSKCGAIERTKKLLKTSDAFKNEMKKKYGNNFDFSQSIYKGQNEEVKVICNTCGNDFKVMPKSLLKNCACPFCSESSLERDVEALLKNNSIKYIHQYRNIWLGLQSLDFYLPDYKVGIECQGRQHFQSVEIFGGDNGLKKTQERDKRKADKCKSNGVRLLYFADKNHGSEVIITDNNKLLKEINQCYEKKNN